MLQLSNFANYVISVAHRDFFFVATVKSVRNFRAAFEKVLFASLLAARTVDIVENMILYDFLTDSSP